MNLFIPLVCALLCGALLLPLALSGLSLPERRRLQLVVVAAFLLRAALSCLLELFPQLRLFHDDASGYEANAMALARSWRGLGPPIFLPGTREGAFNFGYLYVGGALCYVFGPYPLHLALWNGLFGSLNIVVVYRLAAHLFHPAVALRAAILLAFMPSMIVWNAVAVKDPLMVLLISLSLYLYMLLRTRWSILLVLLLAGLVSAIYFIRFYISYFIILSILGTVVVGRAQEGTSRLRNLLTLGVFALVVAATGLSRNLSEGLELATLEQAAIYRVGMATTAQSGFAHDLDVSSVSGAAMALPIGLAVVLFGPFPWQMRGLLPLATLPEMLVWWTLLPSLWRGLRFALTRCFSKASPLFVFCVSLAMVYALTLGNVGAAVRQRTQIFVFLFIFVALGHYHKYCQRRGADPGVLLKPAA